MYRGMWLCPRNLDLCCIYMVPNCMREVKPEAYTPQLVLIGPLHLSLKFQALKAFERGDSITSKSRGYLNMEEIKKTYLAAFAERLDGKEIIDGFKRIIEEEEVNIRESYSESTAWMKSSEFVEMVLCDSVFIIEFMLRGDKMRHEKIVDPLIDKPCLVATVVHDLIMLENQLPYFILEKLFDPIVQRVCPHKTFRDLIILFFNLQGKIGEDSKFRHFTDLHRCVRVETLPNHGELRRCARVETLQNHGFFESKRIPHVYHAGKLDSGGVKFEAIEEEFSMNVRFENGCLKIPRLMLDDQLEMTLRNIMAFEQSHCPYDALVCNYVVFLANLFGSSKDVDLLLKKGIIKNRTRERDSLAPRVNKLRSGTAETSSYYSDIAVEVNKYSVNRWNRSKAFVKRVYFGDLLTGSATIIVMLLLVMTFVRTWAMVTRVYQNES